MRHYIVGFAACLCLSMPIATGGCEDTTLKAQQQQVQEQQQQIEQQQEELERLKNQSQSIGYSPGVASTPGGCDRATEQTATQRGGDKFASGDYQKALDYYKDALAACSTDPKAEMNVARAYEAMGNRQSAIEHFRAAASSGDSSASVEAQNALARLGGQ